MIQYALKCAHGHKFESWFKSASAFETLVASHLVSCPICGDSDVSKTLMAPSVQASRKKAARPASSDDAVPVPAAATADPAPTPAVNAPNPELLKAVEALRDEVTKNSEYVGDDFAKEARAMHLGESKERAIYGETPISEAKELIEEGINVTPLPFMPPRKVN
ncbi:MAG: DUF1178 family protein [Halocynthiibacter sp.]